MTDCKNPGLCECPGMSRCESCGYTQHDKDWLRDHDRYCDEQVKFIESLKITNKKHGGALKKLADS